MPITTRKLKLPQEKRLKRWRGKCPQKVAERIGRANTENFKVLKQGKIRQDDHDDESKCCNFKIAGSTGNVYNVSIGKLPSCTCPDYEKREDACKHTLFVLLKIIGLDLTDELLYQKAFISSELNMLFQMMKQNKKNASSYFCLPCHDHDDDDDDDDMDHLINNLARTNIIEEEGGYEYDNVRHVTGQASERDRSTYRPYHWEKYPYKRWS